MKKQVKFMIVSGVVLVLLAGALIFLLTLPDVQSDNTGEVSTGAAALISKASGDIEQIVVNNSGGKYTLMSYTVEYEVSDESSGEASASGSGGATTEKATIFTMQEHGEYTLDYDKTEELAYSCSNLASKRTINSKGRPDSEYGLDKPRSTVEVRFSDGSRIKIQVGNDAPGDEGTYVRMNDEKTIYLVDSSSVSNMLVEKLQMFDKTLINELGDDEFKSVSISGLGRKTPLKIEKNNLSLLSGYYMSSPNRAACDNNKIETLCYSHIFPFTADSVVKIDVTKDDIKKYGLSEPYYIFEASAAERKQRLIVSKPDGSGESYIMADGGKIIYKAASDVTGFMGGDGSDYMTSRIIYPNVVKLKTAALSYGGTTNEYVLTHKSAVNEDGDEVIKTTVQLSGKNIEENRFDIMLRNISTLTRSGKTPEIDENAAPMLTAEFVYEDGAGTDKLELFEQNGGAVIVLNGSATGTAELETVKTLVNNAKSLSRNKDIEAFAVNDDAESTNSGKAE